MADQIKIGIHQPNYLPWLGYFYKIAQVDIFILLDNVQYEKNSYTNRCQIKTPQAPFWLTLPIKRKFPQMINKAEITNYKQEIQRHLKTISQNYQKAKYFNDLYPELEKIMKKDYSYLSDLNIALIKFLVNKLRIKTKIKTASDFQVSGASTERLINLCKNFKGSIYLSGKGGANYQDEEKFKKAGINLKYTNFQHPNYNQLWKEFVPGMSIIDLLFNCGPESLKILLKK